MRILDFTFAFERAAGPDGPWSHLHVVRFDGNVGLQGLAEHGLRQSFEGNVAVTGRLASGGDVSIPWKLSGPFKANPAEATLEDGELRLGVTAAHVKQQFRDALIEHTRYVREHGEDMPQIRDWVWPASAASG